MSTGKSGNIQSTSCHKFTITSYYPDTLDPTLDFLAGTVAGISGLVVGFPFDTGE